MEKYQVESISELRDLLNTFRGTALFRGQTKHYELNQKPSVVTSFDRNTCIPPTMLRWSRYVSSILKFFFNLESENFALPQALLQHYGWRSFFVDCSSNPAVSAWFACHDFAQEATVSMIEDWEEEPVFVRQQRAQYKFEEGEGHLYIFDKKVAEEIGLSDLSQIRTNDARTRPQAQDALLLGPIQNKSVPESCFLAHIIVKRSVLRDYAAEHGISETNDLFPTPDQDPILRTLLALPWKELRIDDSKIDIPAFCRSLELPEYSCSLPKISPPSVAFYRGVSIGETFTVLEKKGSGRTIEVPGEVLFGSTSLGRTMQFPSVMTLLSQHGNIALEIDDLFNPPALVPTAQYEKGISLITWEPDLIVLSALTVEHPGRELTDFGFARGWFYRIKEDGTWTRVRHPEECDCKDSPTHLRHLESLKIAEYYLSNKA